MPQQIFVKGREKPRQLHPRAGRTRRQPPPDFRQPALTTSRPWPAAPRAKIMPRPTVRTGAIPSPHPRQPWRRDPGRRTAGHRR